MGAAQRLRLRHVAAVRCLAGLPNVVLEDAPAAAAALDLMDDGMDFADALHATRARDCTAMASFDQRFAALAGRLGPLPVRMP